MNGRKNIAAVMGIVLSAGLLMVSFVTVVLDRCYSRVHFQVLGEICQEIIDKEPGAEQAVLAALKEYRQSPKGPAGENMIQKYGYRQADFWGAGERASRFFVVAGLLAGGFLFAFTLVFLKKKEVDRVNALTEYLEKVNTGGGGILLQNGEDEFSRLQDEIYKTVTMLYQTRDAAVDAKNHFAENLANIAHQLKTPVAAISLSTQMMGKSPDEGQLERIRQQLSHLINLEEALLLLSRIDAGTLPLERKEVDVFTVLMLAADNLQELLQDAGVTVNIPEAGEAAVCADLGWTMEAVMNLLKNCMEHTAPGGTVYCDYGQNPLYTQIRIWDRGDGFDREDFPHLFERFYRGKNRKSGGIGIGLALSKAIIESQNGTVCARNLPGGGACFEIRFYPGVANDGFCRGQCPTH